MTDPPPTSLAERELRISWSRLRDWHECTERGHLLGTGKRSPVLDLRQFFHGMVVDKCMRTWLDQDDPQPGQMAAMVDAQFETVATDARESGDGQVKWRAPGDKDKLRVWCRELVVKLEPILYQLAIPYDYQPALRFKVPLVVPYIDRDRSPQRIWLTGEMDLLCEAPALAGVRQMHVWDLKGTADDSYWRKVTGQLIFYDIAAKLLTGAWPVTSGLIQPMCKEQTLSFTFTPEHRRQMLTRIVQVAEIMWRGEHAPKASTAGCDRCPVKHACPRFKVAGKRAPVGLARPR